MNLICVSAIILSAAACISASISCYRCVQLEGLGLGTNKQEIINEASKAIQTKIETLHLCGSDGTELTDADKASCSKCFSLCVNIDGTTPATGSISGTVTVKGCVGDTFGNETQHSDPFTEEQCQTIENGPKPKSISATFEVGCSTCAEDSCNSAVKENVLFISMVLPILLAKMLW